MILLFFTNQDLKGMVILQGMKKDNIRTLRGCLLYLATGIGFIYNILIKILDYSA